MISFPNSGTTYTMYNAQAISNMSVATSYDNELQYPGKPLFVGKPNKSPFLSSNALEKPPLVLTKSHCHCYWAQCTPLRAYKGAFEKMCLAIFTHVNNRTRQTKYDGVPAKVVHLVRDPFDNLVARMHWYDHGGNFSANEAGFRQWCIIADSLSDGNVTSNLQDRYNVSDEIIYNLPCLADWWRYVEWHNNALFMLATNDYPALTIYYEDYSRDYQATIDSLFDFMESDQVMPPLPFIANKTYHSYFSDETKLLAAQFVKQVATPRCWRILRRYFV